MADLGFTPSRPSPSASPRELCLLPWASGNLGRKTVSTLAQAYIPAAWAALLAPELTEKIWQRDFAVIVHVLALASHAGVTEMLTAFCVLMPMELRMCWWLRS